MVSNGADFLRVLPTHIQPQSTSNNLLTIDTRRKLAQQQNHRNWRHVPTLTQHQYAHDRLIVATWFAQSSRFFPLSIVRLLRHEQRSDAEFLIEHALSLLSVFDGDSDYEQDGPVGIACKHLCPTLLLFQAIECNAYLLTHRVWISHPLRGR